LKKTTLTQTKASRIFALSTTDSSAQKNPIDETGFEHAPDYGVCIFELPPRRRLAIPTFRYEAKSKNGQERHGVIICIKVLRSRATGLCSRSG
jgi:hypothetical protein